MTLCPGSNLEFGHFPVGWPPGFSRAETTLALPASPQNGQTRGNRQRGFTVLELLTVIVIISLLGGLGAGAFHVIRRNHAFLESAGRIQNLIRAARNTAVTSGLPARVVVDPANRTVTAEAFELVGEWGFEEMEETSAFGGLSRRAIVTDAGSKPSVAVPGRVGFGFDARPAGAVFDCGPHATAPLRLRVSIEAWVHHDRFVPVGGTATGEEKRVRLERSRRKSDKFQAKAATVVEKSGAFFLGVTPEGALEGSIGEYRLRTRGGLVRPGRWTFLNLRFDGTRLVLAIDGVPRETWAVLSRGLVDKARVECPAAVPESDTPLTISSREHSFFGRIDEVRLAGAVTPDVYRYDEGEHVIGWPKKIHFDGRGHLDRSMHAEGVRIAFVELDDGSAPGAGEQATPRTAGAAGPTFLEWSQANGLASDPLSQAREERKLERLYRGRRQSVFEVGLLGSLEIELE